MVKCTRWAEWTNLEKTRMLPWSNAVGILNAKGEGRDPRLQDNEVEKVAERCLWSIRTLLTDAEALENQYGLRPATKGTATIWSKDALSTNSLSIFRASYKRFCVRFAGSHGRVSTLSKAKWAIHDKPNFEALVQDLRNLVDGLMQVVQIK